MPGPSICTITGNCYTGGDHPPLTPAPFPRKILTVTPLSLNGTVLSTESFEVHSDETTGVFSFGLYQGASYRIKGDVEHFDSRRGTIVTIPAASSATLLSLVGSSVTYPTNGATVQDEGVALPTLINTFNFVGSGVTATQSSAGVSLITIPGSSGGTWGSITGTLSDQLDLQAALDAKQNAFANQSANLVFAGPTSGGAAAPAFRSLVALDIPDLSAIYSPVAHTHTFAALTSKPTTLSGYGITDAQPLDADLTAIAALSGTSGLARKTAADTWSLDTNTYATQAYADSLVVGLLDDRGNFDASGNTFPASGGSGTAGAILKGDLWTISVAGTLGGSAVTAGDVVRALVDTPGQTAGNWAISENNFGYVALNQALADGKIYIGNASGIGTAVTPSGDVTFTNAGVTAIGAGKVTNSMLAGSIDLTTKVTGILPSANGGTGNGFTKFSGPATAEKTFTLPNASASILTDNAAVTVVQGGTGLATVAQGDLLYGSASNTLSALAKNTTATRYLSNTGTSNNPAWAQVDLSNGVTGDLPFANIVQASGASVLVGRGSASGAGDFQEITLGTNLSMSGTTLNATGSSGITIGTTAITSGTNTRILYDNSGVVGEYTITGTGTVVAMQAGPTFTGTLAAATITASGAITQTSSSATAFESGPNGGTNPVFRIVNNTASQADGLSVTGLAAGSGVTLTALSSGSNAPITLTPKGTGGVLLPNGAVGTPALAFASATTTGLWIQVGGLAFSQTGSQVWLSTASLMQYNTGVLLGWGSSFTVIDAGFERTGAGGIAAINGTSGQWAAFKAGVRDGGTTTVTNGLTVGHQSTGTPAAGLGSGVLFNINSSTTADQAAAQLKAAWYNATHSTRQAYAGIAVNLMGSTTLIDRLITGPRTALVDATATSLFEVALPTLTGTSGVINVTIFATNGTDSQVRSQIIRYSATNKAAAYTSEIVIVSEAASCSTGTLTAAWTIVTGTNKITIKCNADTSLASTTDFYATYTLENNSEQAITLL